MDQLEQIWQKLQELTQSIKSIEDKFNNDILHLQLQVEKLATDMGWVVKLGIAIMLGLLALIIQRALGS